MAGDWIKMRTDLDEDPAVIAMARRLSIDEFAVVGRLHKFWSWTDRQSRDGHAPGVTASWLNRFVACDGFAQAMADVQWLIVDDEGLSVPNFSRHNGETAKARALTTDRKRREREQKVTEESRAQRDAGETREEKRREAKKEEPTEQDARARDVSRVGSSNGTDDPPSSAPQSEAQPDVGSAASARPLDAPNFDAVHRVVLTLQHAAFKYPPSDQIAVAWVHEFGEELVTETLKDCEDAYRGKHYHYFEQILINRRDNPHERPGNRRAVRAQSTRSTGHDQSRSGSAIGNVKRQLRE